MSKSAGKKPKEKSDKSKADNFVWSDNEVQLPLEVTNDYKVSKAAKNIDWESSKYTGILELYREHYPSSQEESAEIEKEYPHKKEEITKAILTSKLKNIRLKFRQAIDSGKRSGHGRVVLLYFEICESIWGGSQATSTILSGIETGEIEGGCESMRIGPDSPESPESQDLDTTKAKDISTSDRSSDPTSVERTSQPQTMNPHPASSVGRHSLTSNQPESNTGHFSYTQSLFSNVFQ